METTMTSLELATMAAKAVADKKGADIIIIDVSAKTTLCDYFVIASGRSTTQVRAIADNVDEKLKKWIELDPTRSEGVRDGRWAVLDYGNIIVHVLTEESREYYHLERLWENGENITKYVEE